MAPVDETSRRRRPLLALFATVAALALFGVTNPDKQAHREAFAAHYAERNPVTGSFGVGSALASQATYRSYGLFSTTAVGTTRLTTGLLGRVWAREVAAGKIPAMLWDAWGRGR